MARKAFMCSLCHNGILGGGLYLDDRALVYRTQKLTVDPKYRNLEMPLTQIDTVTWKWIVFPVATVHMASGEQHVFLIFNKPRFLKHFQAVHSRDNR